MPLRPPSSRGQTSSSTGSRPSPARPRQDRLAGAMTDLRSSAPPPLDDSDHVRGPTEAPLLLLYGDFACPSCALADRRLRRLPLRYAFRHFALRSKRPRALALACASEAAARQGAFWPMHDALFDDQGHQDDPHLWRRAQALGLDLERFEADRRAEVTAARV